MKLVTCALAMLAALTFALGARAETRAQAQAQAEAQASPTGRPLVILVSIDGFRADYLARGFTPTLTGLADRGARAGEGMRPAFPSITFPNHYTLVTGLIPDRHGVVANAMEDPAIQPDSHFSPGDYAAVSDPRWWNEATPIWVTAKQQGLHTATMFWPGSEAPIHGVRPDLWAHFDAAITPDQRSDIVLDWLDLPAGKRPDFITLYFDQVDEEGHAHGPDSAEVNAALRQVDAALGRLVAGLRARNLLDRTDLVIVADHGMAAALSPQRVIYLDDLAPAADLHVVAGGAFAEFSVATPAAEQAVLGHHPHMDCWRKADIPARLRYGANPRIPPLFCLAEVGWFVTTHADADRRPHMIEGEHGYDNAAPQMRALFVAEGPDIRRGVVLPVFDNLDVYPLLARLLGVAPAENQGRLSDLAPALATRP